MQNGLPIPLDTPDVTGVQRLLLVTTHLWGMHSYDSRGWGCLCDGVCRLPYRTEIDLLIMDYDTKG